MSRIGNKIITLPEGVSVNVAEGNLVTVTGPKGTLTKKFYDKLTIEVNENTLKVSRPNDEKTTKQLHGTTRALLNGMVEGVNAGFKKELEIKGIGYRAQLVGQNVVLNVGYSHPVTVVPTAGVKFEVPSQTEIIVSGIDKEAVGQMAAEIRSAREPEPYSGKGIMYKGEYVRRKVGKKAGKK
jgi:large subunit ribosomal protein L6